MILPKITVGALRTRSSQQNDIRFYGQSSRPEETPHIPQKKCLESDALESAAEEEQFHQAERQL